MNLRMTKITYVRLWLFFLTLSASNPMLQANDLKLKFDRPAEFFEESFVLGNGTQGAIIYGNPHSERIALNDITLWSGEPDSVPYNPGAYKWLPEIRQALDKGDYARAEQLQHNMQGHNSQYYMPLGNLIINFTDNSEVSDYHRELDLNTARATVSYRKDTNLITTQYLASAPDSLIAVRISSREPIDLTLSFESILGHTVKASDSCISANGYASYGTARLNENGKWKDVLQSDPHRGIRFQADINVLTSDGKVSTLNESIAVQRTTEMVIYITMSTNFDNSMHNPSLSSDDYIIKARRLGEKALNSTFDTIAARQLDDYSKFFSRVSIDLGSSAPELIDMPLDKRLKRFSDSTANDPDLEELYFQFGRYLLIGCSRTPRVPANLQGLWNEKEYAPWRSNYTVNINLEENYWPAEVTNLSEMHAPLLSFIRELEQNGKVTAKEYYNIDKGWCACHNSDIWAMTCPVGCGTDEPMWANWNMGGAWLSSHIWQHYLFTKDRTFLEDYYPTLRGAAEFCIEWLAEDNEGHLITTPSTSPENRFIGPDGKPYATSAGGTADLAIIRQCLLDTRSAALELDVDHRLIQQIDSTLRRLAPYKIGKRGQLQEWAEDFPEQDIHHRHQSHLYGLFPGDHINMTDTPGLAQAAARSLEIKGDNTTGWSTGWRVNLLARLADAPKAYSMYRRLLKYVSPDCYKGPDARRGGGTYPNLLDAHSPFQIDGNFGGTAGVAEMLLQSTPSSITVLPALPDNWQNGAFSGLRARGAYTVDAVWQNGRVTSLSITSDAGGTTIVRVNGLEIPISLAPGQSWTL